MDLERTEITQARSLSIINFILGIWLIIAPYILDYASSVAYWSEVIAGAAIAGLSLLRIALPRVNWPSWLNGLAGIWLIVSPFILGYDHAAAYWNQIIFGIIIAILAYSNVGSVHHHEKHPAH